MTPQLYKEIQDVLKETKTSPKHLVRALELVSLLTTRDVYIANHVLKHVISLLRSNPLNQVLLHPWASSVDVIASVRLPNKQPTNKTP